MDGTIDYNTKDKKKHASNNYLGTKGHNELSKIERQIDSHFKPKKDDKVVKSKEIEKKNSQETFKEHEVEDKAQDLLDLVLEGKKTTDQQDNNIEINVKKENEVEEKEYNDIDEKEISQESANENKVQLNEELSENILEEQKITEEKEEVIPRKKSIKIVYRKGKQIVSDGIEYLIGSEETADRVGYKVYQQDTGEMLGIVSKMILDKNKKVIGLNIHDKNSNAVLSVPIDQFRYDKRGLIFIPRWFNRATNVIEKLEFVDRMYPELKSYLSNDEYDEKSHEFIFKNYPDLLDYFEDGKDLKQILEDQIEKLKYKRQALSDKTIDLTKMRLIKDIDRKEFSDDILELQKSANIFNVNINRYKELLEKLNSTSIGIMCNNNSSRYIRKNESNFNDILFKNHKENNSYQDIEKYKDMTLNELLVELIEDRLVDDIKKELIKNKFSKNERFDEK